MHKVYRHDFTVHLFALGITGLLGFMIFRSSTDFSDRPDLWFLRWVFSAFALSLLLAYYWLYLRSAINRYEIADHALIIHRLFGSQQISWEDLHSLTWAPAFQIVFFRGSGGRILAFTSTQHFTELPHLLKAVHQRSSCHLSQNLRAGLSDS